MDGVSPQMIVIMTFVEDVIHPTFLVELLLSQNDHTVCHKHNSSQSPNVLVGPGVQRRVQLAAIDYHSVVCVLDSQKCEVTREGPMDLRVSMKSRVSRVFPECVREVRSSEELWSYNIK